MQPVATEGSALDETIEEGPTTKTTNLCAGDQHAGDVVHPTPISHSTLNETIGDDPGIGPIDLCDDEQYRGDTQQGTTVDSSFLNPTTIKMSPLQRLLSVWVWPCTQRDI